MAAIATVAPPATLKVELVYLTPDLAREWITYNVGNRKITPKQVERLAGAMKRGEYVAGAAMPVAFTGTPEDPGKLLNGQHHLLAVMESGESITVVVEWGLPEVAQTVMDQQAIRNLQQTLSMEGEAYSSALAATLKAVYNHRATGAIGRPAKIAATTTQLLQLLDAEPRIRESAILCQKLMQEGRAFGLRTTTPLHYYLLTNGCVEDADEFVRRAMIAVNVEQGDPIHRLRRWYLDARGRGTVGGPYNEAGMMVKAWNAWITGTEITSLGFRAGGTNPEPFPTVIIPEEAK